MRPSMFMGGSGLPGAEFVGMLTQTSHTIPIASIPGVAVGDYVIIFGQGGAANYGAIDKAGWARDNYTWIGGYDYRSTNFHRKLASLESVSITGLVAQTYLAVAYRGASRASRISVTQSALTTLTAPGFVRASDCVGVVCSMFDRNDASTNSFTVPSPWVRRSLQSVDAFRCTVADALSRSSYVDGASLTWTNLGDLYARVAQMYELRI